MKVTQIRYSETKEQVTLNINQDFLDRLNNCLSTEYKPADPTQTLPTLTMDNIADYINEKIKEEDDVLVAIHEYYTIPYSELVRDQILDDLCCDGEYEVIDQEYYDQDNLTVTND